MSEWVPAVPRIQSKLPAESMDMPTADAGMPVYAQVIAGIFVAFVATFFLLLIYHMIKYRGLLYCDVMKLHEELVTAVRGTGTGKGRGIELGQEGVSTKAGYVTGTAPWLLWNTCQGDDVKMNGGSDWRAERARPDHKWFKGPVSIV